MKIKSINPTNYQFIGEVKASTEEEVKQAVDMAKKVQKGWREMGLEKRVGILRGLVERIEERKGEISELTTKEMGMPISLSREDVEDAISFFRWYLDNAGEYLSPEVTFEDEREIHKVFYEPMGVAGVIVPWNFPLANFVWAVGQNLVVGNTVVFKHSEETVLFGKLLEEIVRESGLPEGVFNEVYGDGEVGEMLLKQDLDLICFTGSSKVGRRIYELAGKRFIKAVLEMGGSAPGIVFEDADVDAVLETIYNNRFSNCGQMCDGLKRLIVHESLFDEVVEKLGKLLKSKMVGDPADEGTDIGPLVAKRQLDLLEEQVQDALDKGAKVVTGGKRPEGLKGAFYEPSILIGVSPDMRVWQEEVFGPVLPVVSFESEEEAIKLANDTKYGLGSYIYMADKERARRVSGQIETGMVSVNNISYIKPCNPFGGVKNSGMGREHGKFGFYELTMPKVVAMEK